MRVNRALDKRRPPEIFRPLLWSLKWDAIDIDEDREDIIVSAINEGTLEHWRWIIKTYGKKTIRDVLAHRVTSEFHPESLNLARVVFSLPPLRHAR